MGMKMRGYKICIYTINMIYIIESLICYTASVCLNDDRQLAPRGTSRSYVK